MYGACSKRTVNVLHVMQGNILPAPCSVDVMELLSLAFLARATPSQAGRAAEIIVKVAALAGRQVPYDLGCHLPSVMAQCGNVVAL
jgi:hypothetical protein